MAEAKENKIKSNNNAGWIVICVPAHSHLSPKRKWCTLTCSQWMNHSLICCQFSIMVLNQRAPGEAQGQGLLLKTCTFVCVRKDVPYFSLTAQTPFPTPALFIRQKRDPQALISFISCWVLGTRLSCSHFWTSINMSFGAYVLIFLLHQIFLFHFYFFLIWGWEHSINYSSAAHKSLFFSLPPSFSS